MTIQILITDRNLVPVGDPITAWTSLDIVGRYREPSSGSFTLPARSPVMTQLTPGNRVQVIRDGEEFLAGPIEKPGPYQWEVGNDPGQLTVHFAEDLALVMGRVTYPNPAAVATAQTTATAYTSSGLGGDVIRDLVDKNAGPGALAARRVPGLALGAGAGLGTATSVTTRWEALGEPLRKVAETAGGLGFRTRQSSGQILFDVFQPTDRSVAGVRFSRGLGNVRAITYDPEAPTVTAAMVGGQGEGTARTIREVVSFSATTWWRLEQFVDQRQTNVTAELDAAGSEAVATGGETAKLTTITVDTPDIQFGRDFYLGDLVPVEYVHGFQVADVVRGFHLEATPGDGELVTTIIGSQDATRDPKWLRYGRTLEARLGRLEGR